jgi:hypothetical protein
MMKPDITKNRRSSNPQLLWRAEKISAALIGVDITHMGNRLAL